MSRCPSSGTERLSESGYVRAKKESGTPDSIVHATQFFEFVKSIADAATDGDRVRLAHALVQFIAADAAAGAVVRIAVEERTLLPSADALILDPRFEDWLVQTTPRN